MKHLGCKISCLILAVVMSQCLPLQAKADANLDKQVEQVIYLTNLERISVGLTPYQTANSLKNVASLRANELLIDFNHMRPDGRPFDTALEEAGFSVSAAGENIAYDYKGTAESVVSLWMNSQYHRENILSKEFNYIGVAAVQRSDGRYYWTQLFVDDVPAEDPTPLPAEPKLTGDIDNSGRIDSADASVILTDAANFAVTGKSQFSSEQIASCDFDENGICNSIDAAFILEYCAYQGSDGELSLADWYSSTK